MDNLRFALIVLFCFLTYQIWQAWETDYGPKPPPPAPTAEAPATPPAPAAETPAANGTLPTPSPLAQVAPPAAPSGGQRVVVTTDVLRIEIDTQGGDIRVVDLLHYPVEKDQPNQPIRLLSDSEATYFVSQTGFIGADGQVPNHYTRWTAQDQTYNLQPGESQLEVPLTWQEGGVTVTKVYTFRRGSYEVGLTHHIVNASDTPWTARQYQQLQRRDFKPDNGVNGNFIRTYTGGVIYSNEEKYEKLEFKELAKNRLDRQIAGGWLAFIQHYFATAWIPPADQSYHYYSKVIDKDRFVLGAYSEPVTVQPGQEATAAARLYAGPKLQRVLEQTAPGLELTVDYGWLTPIAQPIFWLLEQFHKLFGNWGFAILGVTLLIKLIFFYPSAKGYRSMAKMRKLQPKMQALKEQYGEDRQKFQQELMGLYRKEQVNPLGGCLPILIQVPVFISLYWVLVETVEMRHAPFALWIQDLTAQDPYYVLPILMGITSYIQQSLSPTPADPIQEKVMKIFPVAFSLFFIFFPAGLVLYWVFNNTLSILQQAYITRSLEKAGLKH